MKVKVFINFLVSVVFKEFFILAEGDVEIKEEIPEIKRIVLPFNTVNNKNIQQ